VAIRKLSDFEKLSVKILAASDKAIARSAQIGRNAAVKKAPVDTGRLRGSITATRVGFLWFKIHTNVEYAFFQDQGTAFTKGHFFMLAGYNAFQIDFFERAQKAIGKILTKKLT